MNDSVTQLDAYSEEQRLIALAASHILNKMDEAQITQAELARRIGRSGPHVSQGLHGSRNMTISTMALFALGCGFKWDLLPWEVPIGATIPEYVTIGADVSAPVAVYGPGKPGAVAAFASAAA